MHALGDLNLNRNLLERNNRIYLKIFNSGYNLFCLKSKKPAMYIEANILKNDVIVLKNVGVWLEEITDIDGVKSWKGGFVNENFDLELNGSYKIILEDGREGHIVISTKDKECIIFEGHGSLW
jgi:hypothetical protein